MSRLAALAARAARPTLRAIGLLSGTSADGVDAALVEISGSDASPRVRTLAAHTEPFADDLRRSVLALRAADPAELARASRDLAERFAHAALHVVSAAGLQPADVDVIGSHGQTVVHLPGEGAARADGRRGALSLQIGDAARIRELTGIPVVHDLRSADMAAAGEGAPLVPLVDWLLLRPETGARIALNVGGVANATRITPDIAGVLALDTGPGNAPIDAAVLRATGGRATFDRGGELAAGGRVDDGVVSALLAHPALGAPLPRSLDRETFGAAFVDEVAARHPSLVGADLVATMTEFVAAATAAACVTHLRAGPGGDVRAVLVSGGGVHNPVLLAALSRRLAPSVVSSVSAAGVDPDAKEAVAFAVLACRTLRGLPGNLPAVTGAIGPRVLGSIVV